MKSMKGNDVKDINQDLTFVLPYNFFSNLFIFLDDFHSFTVIMTNYLFLDNIQYFMIRTPQLEPQSRSKLTHKVFIFRGLIRIMKQNSLRSVVFVIQGPVDQRRFRGKES